MKKRMGLFLIIYGIGLSCLGTSEVTRESIRQEIVNDLAKQNICKPEQGYKSTKEIKAEIDEKLNSLVKEKFDKELMKKVSIEANQKYQVLKDGVKIKFIANEKEYAGIYKGVENNNLKIDNYLIPISTIPEDIKVLLSTDSVSKQRLKYMEANFFMPQAKYKAEIKPEIEKKLFNINGYINYNDKWVTLDFYLNAKVEETFIEKQKELALKKEQDIKFLEKQQREAKKTELIARYNNNPKLDVSIQQNLAKQLAQEKNDFDKKITSYEKQKAEDAASARASSIASAIEQHKQAVQQATREAAAAELTRSIQNSQRNSELDQINRNLENLKK